MKIISKFKDFYDHLTNIHDTDDQVVYFRNPEYIELKSDNKHPLTDYINSNKLLQYLLNFSKSSIKITKPNSNDDLGFINFNIIGIYPLIYISPFFSIHNFSGKELCYSSPNKIYNNIYRLSMDFIPDVNIFSISDFENLYEKYKLEPLLSKGKGKNKKPVIDISLNMSKDRFFIRLTNRLDKYSKLLTEKDLIIENPDIFKSLKCPCFYMSGLTIPKHIKTYWGNNPGKYNDIVLNPDFSEVLGTTFKTLSKDLSIRDRIENFIIEQSIKPISEPDNNTKIISAGFDLKTSFRNIK